MSGSTSRRVTAAVLIAGCLCLPLATPAAASSAGLWRAAATSSSFLGSFWSLLVNLWAGDDDHGGTHHGHHHHHGGPSTDEGPGMCPHGGH
jgi:hypothetical protein